MSKVCDSASADLGDCAKIEDLHEKPETDERRGGDEGDPYEDEEEDNGADAIAWIGDEKCTHHSRDSSAGPKAWNTRVGIGHDLRHHGNDAARKVEDEKPETAHSALDLSTEGPQVDHVANDVHPAGVHEHGREQCDPPVAVHDADGNDRPSQNIWVAESQLLQEDVYVEEDDEDSDDGEPRLRPGGVPKGDQAAHYIPPLPRRTPMP